MAISFFVHVDRPHDTIAPVQIDRPDETGPVDLFRRVVQQFQHVRNMAKFPGRVLEHGVGDFVAGSAFWAMLAGVDQVIAAGTLADVFELAGLFVVCESLV